MVMPHNKFVTLFGNAGRAGFSSEYQTVYDSFTTKPSAAIATAQNTMVKSWVDDGVWAKLDWLYVLAAHINGNGEALKNWFNPGTFDGTIVNAPAFVALEGFTGANTKYINANWNPTNDAIRYAVNDASIGIYVRTDVQEDNIDIGINDGNNDAWLITRTSSDTTSVRINDLASGNPANLDSKGLYISARTASNVRKLYKNKVEILSDAQASTALPNLEMYILARNSAGAPASHSTKQLALAFGGSGFSQQNVTDMTDAFETYMDSNGKGVI